MCIHNYIKCIYKVEMKLKHYYYQYIVCVVWYEGTYLSRRANASMHNVEHENYRCVCCKMCLNSRCAEYFNFATACHNLHFQFLNAKLTQIKNNFLGICFLS
jgi:hypothetical protein